MREFLKKRAKVNVPNSRNARMAPVTGMAIPIATPGMNQMAAAGTNPMGSFGVGVLVLYLFVISSRVLDMSGAIAALRIPLVMMLLLILSVLVSGAFLRGLSMTGTQLVLIMYAWAGVSTVFSVWRRGSMDFMKDLFMAVMIFVAIVSLVQTVGHLRRVLAALGFATFVSALMSFFAAGDDTRLALATGSYGDPNGFASALLVGMPLCFIYNENTKGPLLRVMAMLCVLPMLIAFARTGSRGGMITFLFMGVLLFLRVSFLKKVALAIGSLVLAAGFLVVLPDSLRVRYMTLFGSPNEPQPGLDLGGAGSSSEARLALLKLSVAMTIKNPVFGVGPGMFPVAGDMQAKEDGYRRGTWQVTHNTYTQVSSELGFPGLFCFLALLFTSWRTARTVSLIPARAAGGDIASLRQMASVLQFTFIGFTISALFLSLFYWMTWAILAGSMLCLDRLAKREMALLGPAPQPAAPQPKSRPFPTPRLAPRLG